MPKSLLLGLVVACSQLGAAWLALSMPAHWRQVRSIDGRLVRARALALRTASSVLLLVSLLLALRADHPTIAVLVWIMSLGAASLVVAFVLAWRPAWLAWTVRWISVIPLP